MSKLKSYIQFPLCALAFGKSATCRLNAIISYSVVEAGYSLWRKLSENDRNNFQQTFKSSSNRPLNYSSHDTSHLEILYGAHVIGVQLYDMKATISSHDALSDHCQNYHELYGADPFVRIRKDLVFECRDNKGFSYREFSALAAIYSVIGDKRKPVRITQNTIRQRALGYKSSAVYKAEFEQRQDGTKPLSDWVLRDTIEELHKRRFFARATYGRRLTYYSHRMTAKDLRAAIRERKIRGLLFKALEREEDKIMSDQIRNERALFLGKPPPVPDQTRVLPLSGVVPSLDDMEMTVY